MKKYKFIEHYLAIVFMLVIFFLLGTTNVKAATTSTPVDGNNDGISDGVSYWNKGSAVGFNLLKLNNNISLGYGFGLAADASSNYKTNWGEGTMTKDSKNTGDMNTSYSKMNVFMVNKDGKYISSVFQGGNTVNDLNTREDGVSVTSPDFIITQPGVFSKVYSSTMSVLGNGMSNKSYYFDSTRTKFMIAGTFKRDNYNFIIELILRPSPSNSAIVEREMYVRNVSGSTQKFQTLFGEDTKMGISNNVNADAVPIRDLGTSRGIYIENSPYKLSITNETTDGFNHYVGLTRATNSPNWGDRYDSDGNGDEKRNLNYSNELLNSGDSAYSLRWDTTTLANNAVAHYSSTMGETESPYSIPIASKTYVNEDNKTGINNMGDKLKFTLKLVNNGYGSNWYFRQLVDEMPAGLRIDTSSIKKSYNGQAAVAMDSSDYDSSTRVLTVPTEQSLTDDQYETVTFEAYITNDAPSIINNVGRFTGIDRNVAGSTEETKSAETNIAVKKPNYSFTFTKNLKNESSDSDFKTSTTGKKGDVIDYKIEYKNTGIDSLNAGSKITDILPAGLKIDNSSIYIKGPNDTNPYHQTSDNGGAGLSISTGINAVDPNHNVTITFSATVTANSVSTITNTATISGGTSGTNKIPVGDMITNNADLHVQNVDAITSVPSLIDFGSANIYGKTKTLENTNTTGELIVTHPTAEPFKVNVAYDNTDANTNLKNSNGETLPTDGTGLLFIKQRTSSDSDTGTWKPILPSGTPIRTTDFPGGDADSQNLTNYVGVGDWEIKLAPDSDDGCYNGQVTWTMSSSV